MVKHKSKIPTTKSGQMVISGGKTNKQTNKHCTGAAVFRSKNCLPLISSFKHFT